MARRVRIDVLCDVCQSDEIEVEAQEIEPISIGPKGKPLIMGLCKDHWEIWETLRDWLSEYGAPADELPDGSGKAATRASSGSSGAATEVCTVCGKAYQYIGSLRTHVRERHQMTLQEMRGEDAAGGTKPKVERAECKEPGCDVVYAWPEYTRPAQALGLHKRQAHGILGKAKTPKA